MEYHHFMMFNRHIAQKTTTNKAPPNSAAGHLSLRRGQRHSAHPLSVSQNRPMPVDIRTSWGKMFFFDGDINGILIHMEDRILRMEYDWEDRFLMSDKNTHDWMILKILNGLF